MREIKVYKNHSYDYTTVHDAYIIHDYNIDKKTGITISERFITEGERIENSFYGFDYNSLSYLAMECYLSGILDHRSFFQSLKKFEQIKVAPSNDFYLR